MGGGRRVRQRWRCALPILVLAACTTPTSSTPPAVPQPVSPATTVVADPAEAAALAAVLTPSDVTSDFGGSGGPPHLASDAQTAVAFGTGGTAAICDPTNALAGLPPALAGAGSASFESTSPLGAAVSWSAVYATVSVATEVFGNLSADLPCIGARETAPYNTAGVAASAYPVAAPKVGDDAVEITEHVTAAAGTIGASADVILVRVARTLMMFEFVYTVPENELVMVQDVAARASTS